MAVGNCAVFRYLSAISWLKPSTGAVAIDFGSTVTFSLSAAGLAGSQVRSPATVWKRKIE